MLQLHAEHEIGTKSNQYDRPLCSTPMMNENIFVFVAARSASTSCLSRFSVCFAVFVNRLMGQQRSQVTNQCFNCTSQQLKRSSIIEANAYNHFQHEALRNPSCIMNMQISRRTRRHFKTLIENMIAHVLQRLGTTHLR